VRLFRPRSPRPAPELGVNLVGFTRTDFARTASSGSMAHLRTAIGASRAVLVPTYYGSRTDPGHLAGDSPKTATVDSLRSAIEDAARHGLRVALKPHVDVEDGVFRGDLAPAGADRARFFDAYRRLVIGPLARLAAEHPGTVDAFVVGTELSGLAGAEDEWRATVRALRAAAPRVAVGFAANYDALVPGDRRPDVTAWSDELDFLGVDYFPGESDRDYGFDRLARGLRTAARLTGRPLYFTELGSRADGEDGDEGQRRRIAAALDRFEGRVAGFWMYNRFAVLERTDAERYTLAPPAVAELARRFARPDEGPRVAPD
jgi:hypothetical protein